VDPDLAKEAIFFSTSARISDQYDSSFHIIGNVKWCCISWGAK
jgi:hypothetical protein